MTKIEQKVGDSSKKSSESANHTKAASSASAGGSVSGGGSASAGGSASGPIIFYCKDCQEVVDTERIGKKYVYKCKKCGTKNVAFGTKKSIYGFFRLEEKDEEDQQEDDKVQRGSVV